jgi:NAD(P)H-dependent FMN reductase
VEWDGLAGLPAFDEDLETTPPEPVQAFLDAVEEADALLIATPEYNASLPGALKNALDWASRAEPGEAPLACFKGKVCVLMSASPGALGGMRALPVLRNMLLNIHVLVLPDQLGLMRADTAFDETGRLKDQKQQASAEALGAKLVEMLRRLGASG